jgi:GxxExxY protein
MMHEKRNARTPGDSPGAPVFEDGSGEPGAGKRRLREPPREVDLLARRVIDAAVEVHRHLGPGYAEALYEKALVIELGLRGLAFEQQASFRVDYKGQQIGEGRIDLLVERALVVELKAVERLNETHVAQALSYLKATDLDLALLINFNVPVLMYGVKRVVMSRTADHENSPTKLASGREQR